MKRTPYRASSPWPALVDAYNALPAGHPTRRAVVAALTELSAAGLPSHVHDRHVQRLVTHLLLGPAMTRRQIEAGA